MGRLDFIGDLDRSKIVALDFTTAAFRQQAHRPVADWATRPPFYVLGKGPPQVIVGRYADVHEVFSDAERFASELPKGPGYEEYDKFMGLTFLTQTDGAQHARLRRLLIPAFGAHRMEQIESSIAAIVEGMLDDIARAGPQFDGMTQYGAKLVIGVLVSTMMGLNEAQQQVLIDYQGGAAACHGATAGRAVSGRIRKRRQAHRRAGGIHHRRAGGWLFARISSTIGPGARPRRQAQR